MDDYPCRIVASGEEFCNGEGQWLRVLKKCIGPVVSDVTKDGSPAWCLLYSAQTPHSTNISGTSVFPFFAIAILIDVVAAIVIAFAIAIDIAIIIVNVIAIVNAIVIALAIAFDIALAITSAIPFVIAFAIAFATAFVIVFAIVFAFPPCLVKLCVPREFQVICSSLWTEKTPPLPTLIHPLHFRLLPRGSAKKSSSPIGNSWSNIPSP